MRCQQRVIKLVRAILCLGVFALLSATSLAAGRDGLTVYTVNYPLQYFAQRITGEYADVVFPAPPDQDPAFWQPSASTIADYQRADLILLNGAHYAKWVDRVALPRRKLVDTSAVFSDRYIRVEDAATHSHGPSGDHSHSGVAFTTWLDFDQAAAQAQAIADAMMRVRPEQGQVFSRNLAALQADLDRLDQAFAVVVAKHPQRYLLASHPVYQYFQRRFDINLRSVMWEPDQVPDPARWSELERILEHHPARWMIWESRPDPETVARLHGLGVESIVVDPAGNRPQTGDFLSVMQQNLTNLQRVFAAD